MAQAKVWKREEYFVYFPFFKLNGWGKKSARPPQPICSEFSPELKKKRKAVAFLWFLLT